MDILKTTITLGMAAIFLFLLLAHGDQTAKLVTAIGGFAEKETTNLQGR